MSLASRVGLWVGLSVGLLSWVLYKKGTTKRFAAVLSDFRSQRRQNSATAAQLLPLLSHVVPHLKLPNYNHVTQDFGRQNSNLNYFVQMSYSAVKNESYSCSWRTSVSRFLHYCFISIIIIISICLNSYEVYLYKVVKSIPNI